MHARLRLALKLMNFLLFCPTSVHPPGSESVGSPDMCKIDEAERSHRQRQVFAVESWRHSGEATQTKIHTDSSCEADVWLGALSAASSSVPVGQLWRDHPAVVTRPAAVHRHLQGARRGCLGPAGQRGLHSRLFWRKRQEDLLHWPAEPRHPCAHLWGEGPCA